MREAVSEERTRNYLYQVRGGAIFKAIATAVSFLLVPLMISYLGEEQFGVWSTLLTVMSWVVFFDLGVGNGLRNKVAEALAKNEKHEAKSYVGTSYTLIGTIALLTFAIANIGVFFVPWQSVFNTQSIDESTLRVTIQIALLFIVLNFWVGLITALLGAVQKTSMIALGQLVTNVLILILIFALQKTTDASISHLSLIYGISLVLGNVLLSIWFFRAHPELSPSISLNKRYVRPLLSIGLQFFVIQLAVLIIFTTDKMLITQLFGPSHVTQYEVVFKLFSALTFAHALISAPLWSAYTDAFQRSDLEWINKMLHKQLLIFLVIISAAALLVTTAESVIKIWVGDDINVTFGLIVAMALFILVSIWNNIFATIVNGIGEIKIQLYTALVAMIINIPLSVILAKQYGLGLSGIVAGTVLSLSLAAVALPIQVIRLSEKSA